MIVALSGCFDLFHEGHKVILQKAFDLAGKDGNVIVCINGDESVKRLKGNSRPVEDFIKRKTNVVRFCSGDANFIHFDTEEQLLQTYNIFNPDMIIHGDDITDTTKITGFGSWPVLLVPRKKGPNGNSISTTNKIKERNEQKD